MNIIDYCKAPETSLYTGFDKEEMEKIISTNAALSQYAHEVLSQEEAEFLIYPLGKMLTKEDYSEEELQKLAGFRVEKKIIYESNEDVK